MTFYADAQTIANTLIDEFGRNVVYKTKSVSTPDASKPWIVTSSDSNTTVKAVFDEIDFQMVDGTNIKMTDKKMIIAHSALGFEPDVDDQVVDGSTTYKIFMVRAYNPGDTSIYYEVFLRK